MKIPFLNLEISRSRKSRPGFFDDFWYMPTENPTSAGVDVNESTALTYSPVWAAVRKISETIASLPLVVYKDGSNGKVRDTKHALYPILHDQPNDEMTRIQMWEALMAHLLLWGNCYCHIQRDLIGRVIALWPLDPSKIEVKRPNDNGLLVYQYRMTDNGQVVNFPPWEILHIAGLGFNGISGYSVIGLAREGISTGMAYEQYAGRFFSNNATPSGFLEIPGMVDEQTKKTIRADWYTTHGGVSKSQLIGILGQGMKFNPMTVNHTDAQFLESRKFSVTEICRWFNIAPHMIFDLDRSTNNNIEQQSLEAVIYTFRPWCVRIEQAIKHKLITEDNVTAEHRLEGLLRGDTASRTAYYMAGRQWGWLSINDIRELENMEKIDDGNEYLQPLNMKEVGTPDPEPSSVDNKLLEFKQQNKA